MGIGRGSVYYLMKEGLRVPLCGRIATLGKQDVWMTVEEIRQLAQKLGYPLVALDHIEMSHKPDMRSKNLISDVALFKLLGFQEIVSFDASSYEQADCILDLNQSDSVPEFEAYFDFVLDAGTLEHVFHIPNALKAIYRLLKTDGRILHISPSSNHMDHGFYMFSPTLFMDYYKVNQFIIQSIDLIQYRPQQMFSWRTTSYKVEEIRPFSYGGLDDHMYAVACLATKQLQSSSDKIPQQFQYAANLWISSSDISNNSWLKETIKSIPILYKTGLWIQKKYRKFYLKKLFHTKI